MRQVHNIVPALSAMEVVLILAEQVYGSLPAAIAGIVNPPPHIPMYQCKVLTGLSRSPTQRKIEFCCPAKDL